MKPRHRNLYYHPVAIFIFVCAVGCACATVGTIALAFLERRTLAVIWWLAIMGATCSGGMLVALLFGADRDEEPIIKWLRRRH